ncbi:MAG TPA: hypothetical protein VGI20_05495 [Rhizomicrobium sp.]|jgi:hypothetical protein
MSEIPGRRPDGRFHAAAGAVAAAIVFAGFARSYYLRPLFKPTSLSLWLDLHGLLMTSWFALFLVQVVLVSASRRDIHRKLGTIGATLAPVITVVGAITLFNAVARRTMPFNPKFVLLLLAFDGLYLVAFAAFVLTAVWKRNRPDIHKRLMLLATLSLLPPALGRITGIFVRGEAPLVVLLSMLTLVIGAAAIDTFRHRRLSPALQWGAPALVAANVVTFVLQSME